MAGTSPAMTENDVKPREQWQLLLTDPLVQTNICFEPAVTLPETCA
jgi:hypothetical protein